MLSRAARLTHSADLRRVRSRGRCWAGPLLVLCALRNDLGVTRFGFSASRRVGGAVVRNRARRLMSEAVRLQYHRVQPGWDVVCIARVGIVGAEFASVERAVSELMAGAGLYASEAEAEPAAGQRS